MFEMPSSGWAEIFLPATPLVELLVRGSAMYLGVLTLIRLMPRRSGGELARMDLVFVLLIAAAATPALGDFTSVADALIVVLTLMGWDWLINMLSYRLPLVERIISAPPVEVIRDGRLLRRNMRREYLTDAELESFLRSEGIDDLARVKTVYVESDGKLSVIARGPATPHP